MKSYTICMHTHTRMNVKPWIAAVFAGSSYLLCLNKTLTTL